MRAGRLDRKITLRRKATSQDSYGEEGDGWTTLIARRASGYRPLRGEEKFTAEQFVAGEQVEFRIRYSANLSDLSPLDRVIYPALDGVEDPDLVAKSRLFDIMAVHEIGRRKGLQIMAVRRATP